MRATPVRAAAIAAAAMLAVTACGGSDEGDRQPLSLAVLGDSFSSGEGTDDASGDCGRSPGAYGQLVAAAQAERGEADFAFAPCSGAVVADLDEQVAALDGRRFEIVTVTIGGNDAGYANVLADCLGADELLESATGLLAGDAEPTIGLGECDTSEEELNARIDALPDRLAEAYRRLADEVVADSGALLVLGYPQLFADPTTWPADEGERCDGITAGDALALRAAGDRLNEVAESAAAEVGATFVDVEAHFAGHERCTDDPWLNGVDLLPRVRGSFHPNDEGHRQLADLVLTTVDAT